MAAVVGRSRSTVLVLVAALAAITTTTAAKKLREDSGWFCFEERGNEKCFRLVRPDEDTVSHRECAQEVCPDLNGGGEGGATLACITSNVTQRFLEKTIEEEGFMDIQSGLSSAWIGAFWKTPDDEEVQWVDGCSTDYENFHEWGTRWCGGDLCVNILYDTAEWNVPFSWHAGHCATSFGPPPFCLCQKGMGQPISEVYQASIGAMERQTYDLGCVYFGDPEQNAWVIWIAVTTALFLLLTSSVACKWFNRWGVFSTTTTSARIAYEIKGRVSFEGGQSLEKKESLEKKLEDTRRQMHQFEQERIHDRLKKYESVLVLSMRLIFPGLFWVGIVYIRGDTWDSLVAHPLASLILATGMAMLSSCPLEDLDLDQLVIAHPRLRMACWGFFTFAVILTSLTSTFGWQEGNLEWDIEVHKLCCLLSAVPGLWLASGMRFHEAKGSTSSEATTTTSKFGRLEQLEVLLAQFLVGRQSFGKPRPTTLFVATEFLLFVPSAVVHLIMVLASWFSNDETYRYHVQRKIQWSVITLFSWTLFGYLWSRERLEFHRTRRQRGWSPTLGAHMSILTLMLSCGIYSLAAFSYEIAVWPQNPFVISSLLMGLFLIGPPFFVWYFGRERVYNWVAWRVDMDSTRRIQDGAFLAALLSKAWIEVGGVYFQEREKSSNPDQRFDETDPRYHFKAMCVLQVTEAAFRVTDIPDDPLIPSSQLSAESIRILGKETAKIDLKWPVRAIRRADSIRRIQSIRRTSLSASEKSTRAKKNWKKGFQAVKASIRLKNVGKGVFASPPSSPTGGSSKQWIPLPGYSQTNSHEDILERGTRGMRALDWSSISFELLDKKSRANLAGKDWYSLSRPLKQGERVDFFVSHSWSDDAMVKWITLCEVANDFMTKNNGRRPTFWFDKACIDQDHIEDGLAVLPLYVMACEKMLILCGDSYPDRLWCAWEICTLLSFVTIEQALRQVVLVPFGSNTQGIEANIKQQMAAANVAAATAASDAMGTTAAEAAAAAMAAAAAAAAATATASTSRQSISDSDVAMDRPSVVVEQGGELDGLITHVRNSVQRSEPRRSSSNLARSTSAKRGMAPAPRKSIDLADIRGSAELVGDKVVQRLLHFDVSNARCYDPNDEARLRAVIEAVGHSDFNAKVRSLAAAACQQPSRSLPAKSISRSSISEQAAEL